MTEIKVLSDKVIDQIAAGEIIERPASVVKELLENSIDAKASKITVEIEDGGKKLIRISDNGEGMTKDNLKICFKRFATSKITETNDLEKVSTYGFRGEALPSIASVSKMSIETCYKNSNEGYIIKNEGGILSEIMPSSCNDGTKVTVQNLFYNVPARLKFLKKENTEKKNILSWINSISLAHHKIAFKLISDKSVIFECAIMNKEEDRYLELFGREFVENIIHIKFPFRNGLIHGFISKPGFFKRDRTGIKTFVNGRIIQNKILNYVISEFYRDKLMHGQYPFVTLQIELNPSLVDVNVHPAKLEVRFRNEDEIIGCSLRAFNEAYSKTLPKTVNENKEPLIFNSQTSSNKIPLTLNELKNDLFGIKQTNYQKSFSDTFNGISEPGHTDINNSILKDETNDLSIYLLGQAACKYLIAETDEGLYIFDQHASHERILYEQMLHKENSYRAMIQNLLMPITIDFTPEDFLTLEEHIEKLNELGFIIEIFGKNTMKIEGLPSNISGINIKDYFLKLASYLRDPLKGKPDSEKLIRGVCRHSVMFGEKLNNYEQKKIINDLFKCKNPSNCPHGRPTFFKLTWDEINRKLGRI